MREKRYSMTSDEKRLAERAPERWTGANAGVSRRNEDGTVTVRQWNVMLHRYVVRVINPKKGTYYYR